MTLVDPGRSHKAKPARSTMGAPEVGPVMCVSTHIRDTVNTKGEKVYEKYTQGHANFDANAFELMSKCNREKIIVKDLKGNPLGNFG